jgi:hypothetical protein
MVQSTSETHRSYLSYIVAGPTYCLHQISHLWIQTRPKNKKQKTKNKKQKKATATTSNDRVYTPRTQSLYITHHTPPLLLIHTTPAPSSLLARTRHGRFEHVVILSITGATVEYDGLWQAG